MIYKNEIKLGKKVTLVQQHIQMLIKSIEGKLRYSITCKILTVVFSSSCTSKNVKYLSCFFSFAYPRTNYNQIFPLSIVLYYTFQCSFYVIYFLSWLIWNIFTRSKDDSSLSSIIYQMKNTFYKSIKKVRVCCINLHPLVVNVTIIEMVFEVCRRNIRSANLDFFFDEGGRLRNNYLYQGCPWPMLILLCHFSRGEQPPSLPPPP